MSTSTAGSAPMSASRIRPLPLRAPPVPPSRPVPVIVPRDTVMSVSASSMSASAATSTVAALAAPAPPEKATVGGVAVRS